MESDGEKERQICGLGPGRASVESNGGGSATESDRGASVESNERN